MTLREWKNRFALLFSALFVGSLSLMTLPGCEEGVYEDTGEEMDEAVEESEDAMDEAAEDAEDAIDDLEDEADDLEDDLDYDADDTIDEGTP